MTTHKSIEEVVEEKTEEITKILEGYRVGTDGIEHTYEKEKMLELFRTTLQSYAQQQVQEAVQPYYELLTAVGNKHEGETRHQTALRYIKQAEQLPLPDATSVSTLKSKRLEDKKEV